jgi:peptide deformylase
MRQIITYPDPILRRQAEPVNFQDESLSELLEDMQEIMYQDDGVGLAAPQIGVSKRIIVIDGGMGLIQMINPKIIKTGDDREAVEEGCLSVPDIRVTIARPTQITIEGLNEKGEPVCYDVDGLLARIFQHENDHLDGKLIIDYLSSIQRTLLRSKLKQLEKNTSR